MEGKPILFAIEALKLFLHSLPLGSKFNVVPFGSTFTPIFPDSVEYNEENLRTALARIFTFDANMGEESKLLEPLTHIFSQTKTQGLPQCIFLLTKGAVANPE